MCYICGNLELNDFKHQEKVFHSLKDEELDHVIFKVKNQIKNIENFPLSDSKKKDSLNFSAVSELRRILLNLIGEKLSRFRAR